MGVIEGTERAGEQGETKVIVAHHGDVGLDARNEAMVVALRKASERV